MKKAIIIFVATVLVVGLMPVTSFAHGHCGNSTTTSTYSLCSVENCHLTGDHKHNNTTYTGHSMNDGHDYHQLCNVNNCGKTGTHEHNGTTRLPHTNGDGHGYHNAGGHRGGHR